MMKKLEIDNANKHATHHPKRVKELKKKPKSTIETTNNGASPYDAVFRLSPSPTGIFNFKDGTILDVNDALCTALGFSREELLGSTPGSLNIVMDTRDRRLIRNMLDSAGQCRNIERTYRRKDGSIITVLQSAELGVFRGERAIISVYHDITERKKLEDELRDKSDEIEQTNKDLNSTIAVLEETNDELSATHEELRKSLEEMQASESRYRLLFNAIPIGVGIADMEGNILAANPALREMTGYTPEETSRLHLKQIYDDITARSRLLETLQSSGHVTDSKIRFKRKDGSTFPALLNIEPITIDGKRATLSTVRDITEQVKSELALSESEKRFRMFFEVSFEAIGIHDKGKLLDCNLALAKMFGYELNELKGINIIDLTAQESRETLIKNIMSGFEKPYEAVGLRKDGTKFWAELSGKEIPYEGGTARVTALRDITERKNMEQEIQRTQRIESIGLLAGGIAHDFNNILTAVIGNISVARLYASGNENLASALEDAEKASMRAKELTRQLLTFSKGGMPVKMIASIADLVTESAGFVTSGTKTRCDFFIPDDLWAAEVDPGQISQVIQNIVINADQAMPDGGIIKIYADNVVIDNRSGMSIKPGTYIKITLTDNGPGIPPEILPKIFDPYFTTKNSGNGLGLAIVYSIIQKHGGYIDTASTVGVGTTFTLYIPTSQEQTAAGVDKHSDIPVKSGRILLMDDEKIVRDTMGRLLAALGYDVIFAANGQEAIARFTEEYDAGDSIDLVILDLTVHGGMGGKECVNELRRLYPGVRAVVSSGYSNDPIMSDYRSHGFRAAISKPFRLEDLKNVLSSVLGSK